MPSRCGGSRKRAMIALAGILYIALAKPIDATGALHVPGASIIGLLVEDREKRFMSEGDGKFVLEPGVYRLIRIWFRKSDARGKIWVAELQPSSGAAEFRISAGK